MSLDAEKQFLCPRLIDYLTIVGARHSNNPSKQNTSPHIQAPELLRRYPIQDHKDFPMPLDMVYFCQPEGCSSVGPRRTALREASSFVFTLTDKDSGKTRYGICVNFYRPIEKSSANLGIAKGRVNTTLRRDSWRKSMEKSSDSAFSSDYRSSNVGPSDSEKDCPSRRDSESTAVNLPRLGVIPANDSESGGSHSPSPRANACNESSNPRRVGGSKQLSRDNVWSVLTGHASDTTSSIVLHDVKEIETWILKLLSSPVPIPGKTKVEVEVLSPSVYDPLVFALPSHTRFSLVDFPLHLPLELLEDGAKRAYFLYGLNETAYELLKNMCVPNDPESETFKNLSENFDKHFKKSEGESIAIWAARVRALAAKCQFGVDINNYMRDCFIVGFPEGPILDRLFEEDVKTLTLDKAIDIAINNETSVNHYPTKDITIKIKEEPEVEDLWNNDTLQVNQQIVQMSPNMGDIVCGKLHSGKYMYENYDCRRCGEKGHLANVCRRYYTRRGQVRVSTEQNRRGNVSNHFLEDNADDSDYSGINNDNGEQMFNFISNENKPILVNVKIETREFEFELDTGLVYQCLLLAPTPFVIGLPASFLMYKKNFKLPDDVWLVDLDSNKLLSPYEIPPLPEPEGTILKNHLKQAIGNLSIPSNLTQQLQPSRRESIPSPNTLSISRSKSPEEVSPVLSPVNTNMQQRLSLTPPSSYVPQPRPLTPSVGFNPFIYGNDVDSVDVATRVAMVRFFNSQNLLANFSEHTRTLRLYPRPVVAFQINSFLRSRPRASQFLNRFARTQAVEFLAEWSLTPNNVAFQRVHTGVLDPALIGDKPKWYLHTLEPIKFVVWDDGSSLNGALRSIQTTENQPTDESGSDSEEAESTSSSYSSLSDFVSEMVSSDLSPGYTSYHEQRKASAQNMSFSSSVDVATVYKPPSELRYPEGEVPIVRSDSPQTSSSSDSDLSSPSFNRDSELDFGNKLRNEQVGSSKTDKDETGSCENESDSNSTTTPKTVVSANNVRQVSPTSETERSLTPRKSRRSITPIPPITPCLQKQPSVGNVLARTSSFGSSGNGSPNQPLSAGSGVTRQSSQGSLFEQFTSQAKELVKETTRQSSQDGILAQMDKVELLQCLH
ncbi:hypothetical protein NQ314_001177 [Rhamnusium bicolor]|uniref:CCHC-type domain-containing protein n=1 Tax=Rhamnusium bicolor TaxID=1586634 RepID=A0AAV8ZUE5_9CUCU|nr:hypothetical protein NQ314_001177 [Rhamnusium bicolor]